MSATPKPMLAKSQEEIPLGEGWRYEPKWDGFRTIATRTADGGVTLASRNDRPLGRYFPEIVALLETQPPASYVLDGELVMITEGEMNFDGLQLRLHPAASRVNKLAAEIPATFVPFDVLEVDGRDVRGLDTDARRDELTALVGRLGGSPAPEGPEGLPPGPAMILTPRTDDPAVARTWFEDEAGFGQDGLVARRADSRYVEGERVMVKIKHHRTADCVVGGYRKERKGDGVGSLLLGLYDREGRLHYVGHTSAFKAKERRELREILAPLEGGDAFGFGDWGDGARSPGGQSRWSAGRDLEWVGLEPKLVVEVRFERLQSGRFRHSASIVRWRQDRDPESCTFEQLGAEPPSWAFEEG
ncbi:MAG TPA: ATP-dependent DNA ligase [Actinomycetota bacterium]|jgi:ATP-dependent DNA ligase